MYTCGYKYEYIWLYVQIFNKSCSTKGKLNSITQGN